MPKSQFQFSVMAAALSALFAPTLHAASAGKVDFATPGVNAVGPNGQARPLSKGSEIQPGETIDTGAGRAQLRFTDGALVSLQPQTQFRLESYGYDKDDPKKNSVVMNMLKGGLRSITGLIGKTNREGYKLQTATATVGIRGTEFAITSLPNGAIIFQVTEGTVSVTNGAGSTDVGAGQSTTVTSSSSAPTPSASAPYLPPSVSGKDLAVPPNAVQDANSVATPLLAGTFDGQWRTMAFDGSYSDPMPYGYGGENASFTVSPSGHLTSASYGGSSERTTISLGAGVAQSYGNDGVMAWGRWTGETTITSTSTYEGGNPYTYTQTRTYDANNPLHYVVGIPATMLPTSGSATYSMYGGTAPSCSGACGTISIGSTLNINFGGTYSGSYDIKVANSAQNVNLSGSGSLYFSGDNINFAGNSGMSGTINGTGGGGSSSINGFLANKGATHAGAVYNINYQGYGGPYTSINGAAVYKK